MIIALAGLVFVEYSEINYSGTPIQAQDIRSGLVGYWPFNEGLGTTTQDVSGYGNLGHLVNSPTWIKGIFGNALNFKDGMSYVSAYGAPYTLPNFTLGFTESFWIKLNSPFSTNCGERFCDISGISSDFNIWITIDSSIHYTQTNGNAISCYYPYSNDVTNWHFIVLTISSNQTAFFYIDSKELCSSTNVHLPIPTAAHFNIANGWDGPPYVVNASMEEVRLYDLALSQTQTSELYQYYENILAGNKTK